MSNTIHAFDFLDDPTSWADSSFYVLFGGDRFLQLLVRKKLVDVLSGDVAEFNSTILDGDSVSFAEIQDELTTVNLFSQDKGRITIVDRADALVQNYRDQLEALVKTPRGDGHLVLLVSTWPRNTKLFKALDKVGCQIHCADPPTKRGGSKSRDSHRIAKWIVARAKQEYGLKLTQALARFLLELVEWNLGRADQELAKLSVLIASGEKITEDDIQQAVGGWRAQSIWDAVAAAAQGDTAEALKHLNNLLQSGEHPFALYGQLSWSLRRYGRVWEIISRQGRAGERPDLSVALNKAGFRSWNDELSIADASLKQLGRQRVKQIYHWLLETDLALKGSHSDEHRARLALETLFFRMSDQFGSKQVAEHKAGHA